jgi:hypothetical protein
MIKKTRNPPGRSGGIQWMYVGANEQKKERRPIDELNQAVALDPNDSAAPPDEEDK